MFFLTLRHNDFAYTNIPGMSKNSNIFRRTRKSTSKITPKINSTRLVMSYHMNHMQYIFLCIKTKINQSYFRHTNSVTYPFSIIYFSNMYCRKGFRKSLNLKFLRHKASFGISGVLFNFRNFNIWRIKSTWTMQHTSGSYHNNLKWRLLVKPNKDRNFRSKTKTQYIPACLCHQ